MNTATKALIEQVQLLELFEHKARDARKFPGTANPPKWRGVDLPSPDTADWYEHLIELLKRCEPFWVQSQVSEVLVNSSASIPDWPIAKSDLFVLDGFILFQTPLVINETTALGRFLWNHIPEENGVILSFTNVISRKTHSYAIKYGKSPRDHVKERIKERIKEQDDPLGIAMLRMWQTFLRFVSQVLVNRQKEVPERVAIRQAERVGLTPRDVSIITLRRLSKRDSEGQQDEIEWSHRWWVSTHWRQQPCGPGLTERRPVLILPYLKGPEDKPILPKPQRIFDVSR